MLESLHCTSLGAGHEQCNWRAEKGKKSSPLIFQLQLAEEARAGGGTALSALLCRPRWQLQPVEAVGLASAARSDCSRSLASQDAVKYLRACESAEAGGFLCLWELSPDGDSLRVIPAGRGMGSFRWFSLSLREWGRAGIARPRPSGCLIWWWHGGMPASNPQRMALSAVVCGLAGEPFVQYH